MKESDVIQAIGDCIAWYRDKGNTAPIADLLDCRDQIATNCWNLAEHTGDAKTDYNQVFFQRKIAVARQKQASFGKGFTVSKADVESIIATEGLFSAEIIKEGYAFKLDLMLKQANKVIDAISQRVSYMKIEESQTRFQNQT